VRAPPARCLFLAFHDELALFGAQRGVAVRRVEEDEPEHDPDDPDPPVITNAVCQS